MKIKPLFQIISYLQYPVMLLSVYYMMRPLLNNFENLLNDFNIGLTLMGIGTGVSTLQDTTKVQNKLSLKVYQSQKKTSFFLILIGFQIFLFIAIGLWGLLQTKKSPVSELSFGLISLGIGMIGILKAASEMAEYQYNLVRQESKANNQS